MSIRTLVVDESASYARITRRALEEIDGVHVIGRCAVLRDALAQIVAEAPDLVILNSEGADGNVLELLRALRREGSRATVVVLGNDLGRASEFAIQAAALGPLEILSKPQRPDPDQNMLSLRAALTPLVDAAACLKNVKPAPRARRLPDAPASAPKPRDAERCRGQECAPAPTPRRACSRRPRMLLIGASTGGTEALTRVIPRLPGQFPVPVLIVQHMPPLFTETFAESLNNRSALRVQEAREGDMALPGNVYIAPGGRHLKVSAGPQHEIRLHITADPPENNCRPAVDYLFRSVAQTFPGQALAVIMTGMGRDGTLGLRHLKDTGCSTIAQDEASCAVFGMPKEAIQAGVVDLVTPLDSIAIEIAKAIH